MQSKKGLLLIQLGTPDAPSISGVRRYLRLFLSDKRVFDLPAPFRYLLLYGVVLPLRSKHTAKAYQSIWTSKGSPLRVLTHELSKKLQKKCSRHHVVAAMRYGEPNLHAALRQLKDCDEITILPLYPQYASSTTGSSIEIVCRYFQNKAFIPTLHIINSFYAHPAFIKAQSIQIKPFLKKPFDHLLLSYHGLPVRHLTQIGCKSVCKTACPSPDKKNTACYRAQCFETSHALAKALNLNSAQYTTAFQSRLGKTPWIEPYTENMLIQLSNTGIKRLLIACPAFVTDCLETLEEINIRAKKTWETLGGESLTLIPCLNAEDHWIDALVDITTNENQP